MLLKLTHFLWSIGKEFRQAFRTKQTNDRFLRCSTTCYNTTTHQVSSLESSSSSFKLPGSRLYGTPVKRSVSTPVLQLLVVSMVLTRLEYWTLAGLPRHVMDRLQSVINTAARMVSAPKCDHVTRLLREHHWLSYPERIAYSLAVLVFRCHHSSARRRIFRTKFTVRLT